MKSISSLILRPSRFDCFLVAGVDLIEEDYPAFTWGEEEISDDQVS